ncbi:DUF6973 domain-containing protein [Namhaeicola litoreus]|uniref:DUF6973 domain-containing protein n=1 Tax=Namhaeicola litoreus TaxID=1052145 RepID=A0ABW3XX42_9FLAO
MKRKLSVVLICLICFSGIEIGYGQPEVKRFFELSSPEQIWVVTHLFKARKGMMVTSEVLRTTDSVKNSNSLDQFTSGGKIDAFKHSLWMARLSQAIGENAALSLGRAHEKGNFQDFKKRIKEDGEIPDLPASEMDDFNNKYGAKLIRENPNLTEKELIIALIDSIKTGKLRILKRSPEGIYLNCEGDPIVIGQNQSSWESEKCLVPSNK